MRKEKAIILKMKEATSAMTPPHKNPLTIEERDRLRELLYFPPDGYKAKEAQELEALIHKFMGTHARRRRVRPAAPRDP